MSSFASNVAWALLPAMATSQSPQFVTAPLPASIASAGQRACLGDIDGDGDLDLYASQLNFLPTPGLFANDGTGQFTAASNQPPPPSSGQYVPFFFDFDGDFDLDLFLGYPGPHRLFRNNGGGPWTDVSSLLPPSGWTVQAAAIADFDGDGDLDIAGTGTSIGGGRNQMLVNGGASGFTSLDAFPGQGLSIVAFDADGDGDLDLAVGGFTASLWRNDGGMTFTDVTATQMPALASTWSVAAGDVDGDGDPDLVLGVVAGDVLLRNLGGGVFALVPGALPAASSTAVTVLVDVDGDSDLDLLRGSNLAATLARNDGTGTFTPAANSGFAVPGLAQVLAGDLDRDGDVDLVALRFGVGGASAWRNQHRDIDSAGPPVRGQTWNVRVWSQPGYATTLRPVQLGIGLARLPQPLLLPPFGDLWLDFAAPVLLAWDLVPVGIDVVSFAFPIPAVPAIAGVVLHAQALVGEAPGAAGLRLSSVWSAAIQ